MAQAIIEASVRQAMAKIVSMRIVSSRFLGVFMAVLAGLVAGG